MKKRGMNITMPLTRTVKAPYDRSATDAFVPDWDRVPGMGQHAMRVSLKDRPTSEPDDNHPPIKSNHPKV